MSWEEFDATVNDDLKSEIENVEANDIDFNIPYGTYDVVVDKIELKPTKSSGAPMMSVWMKILDGPHAKGRLFYNQVMNPMADKKVRAFQIYNAKKFLESLKPEGVNVTFESFTQLDALCGEVLDAIAGRREYRIEYDSNDKGYDTYKVIEVYDVQ